MTDIAKRKTALMTRLAELNGRLGDIEARLDAPAPRDDEDRATEREDDEVLERMGQSGLEEIRRIEAALARIEDGSYGVCARCGDDISEARLDVVPHAALCRRCAA